MGGDLVRIPNLPALSGTLVFRSGEEVRSPEYLGVRSEILEYVLKELKVKGLIIRSSEEHVE